MKKYLKFMLTAILVVLCGSVFAQSASPDVFSVIVSLIPAKFQALALTVVTVLWLVSEILGSTSWFKANSIFQQVKIWISGLYSAESKPKP